MSIHSLGIVGGGFSGVATAFSAVLELKQRKEAGQDIGALRNIDIIGEVTTGPAYNAQSDALILNRSVEVMDPLAPTGYGFLKYLNNVVPEKDYTKNSFVPRGLYGDYILWLHDQTKQLADELGIQINNMPSVAVNIERYADNTLSVTQENGVKNTYDHVVLATGHEFEERVAVKNHANYIAPYSEKNWEDKLALAKLIASNDKELSLLGWGGTSLDIATLVGHDFNGVINVYAPLGDTSIPFYGKIPPNPEQIAALRPLVDAFYNKLGDDKHDPARVAYHIRGLLVDAKAATPAILEQHVIDYLLLGDDPKRVSAPENKHVHEVAIVFNGNPVAPERQKLLEHLIASKKINFIAAKIKDVQPHSEQALELHFEDERAPVVTQGRVIDGTTVRRALAVGRDGQILSPLLRSAIETDLIAPSIDNPRVLPTFAGDNITAVGAITYHIANSVGVFYTGIKAVAKHIGATVTGVTNVVDFAAELDLRSKDGGKPNVVLDVRDAEELLSFSLSQDRSRQLATASLRGGEVQLDNPVIAGLPKGLAIHVLCEGGVRSAKAIERLEGAGFRLINVDGGAKAILGETDPAVLERLFMGSRVFASRAPDYKPAAATLKSACG
ncbi:MAG: FAD/NAD(P)-binding protein [Alphaproteobacteria bacterium]|nr:FAD/NAD(P)-binding protein [Alphaproteobacteria bacterium]